MQKYLLIFILAIYHTGHAQIADSLKRSLAFARSDTARISLYIQLVEEDEDSTVLLYCDTAQRLINSLLPKADGKMKLALYDHLSNAIYYKSTHFANAEAFDSAIVYLNAAMAPALIAKNRLMEAKILNDLGVCAYHKNDIAATIDHFKKSLAIREQLNDDVELRNAYNNMAFIYKETGFIDNSLELNFKALALAEKIKSDFDIANSLNNIGEVYHRYLLDYGKALEYYNKSIAIREKLHDKKNIGLVKNNIAAIFSAKGDYAEAIRYYTESLALRRSINYRYGMVNSLSNLGFNYMKIKEYDKARSSLEEGMELNKTLQNRSLEQALHRYYAEFYIALEKPDSAIFHAIRAHTIDLEFGNPLNISISAELLSRLYEKKGDYNSSLRFYKLYKKMQDSILNDNLKKAGIKKELEYEYLKKKNETDKVYDQQMAKKNLYTWILVVLLIAAVVVGYVLYKRYRLKQQLKEVEIRNKIASDLHDDVGSTLSSIRMYSSIVKGQPNQTTTACELLDKISNNSIEMIENMSDIVWMIKPGNDEFKSIENRMFNFANDLCSPAEINFEFNKDGAIDAMQISMELRRDIYLIFKEAVNNAVKYSACHSIRADISLQNNQLEMHISDDGNGFDTAVTTNGNGLSNMQKRTAMHKGTFAINSAAGEGTEIVVCFPL